MDWGDWIRGVVLRIGFERGSVSALELSEVDVAVVGPEDEARFRALMQAHHYLGASAKVGATAWYVAHRRGEWLALAAFSASARKCRARDEWIGWDFRTQHGRLHLIANNARFLILPGRGVPNLGSRVLGLCARRLARDWPARFGHPLLMLETFVDVARFRGTVYRAAGWLAVGETLGFRRYRSGYVAGSTPKLVLLRPLVPDACRRLSAARLDRELWKKGVPRTMIGAAQQESLYAFFRDIDDPRTRKGRRHSLPSVLALATGATLCGMRGWKAISEWVDDLGEKALARFGVRLRDGVRHGRKSILIASQIPVEGWPKVIGEPTIADAVLDRIVHNAYRIELKGESQRKRNKPPPLDGGDDGNRAPA